MPRFVVKIALWELPTRPDPTARRRPPIAATGQGHGNQIPRTQPGKNATTGPGNRYPANGQQRPTPAV